MALLIPLALIFCPGIVRPLSWIILGVTLDGILFITMSKRVRAYREGSITRRELG
jgi:hypothetical protein